jgi:hypothetical protein
VCSATKRLVQQWVMQSKPHGHLSSIDLTRHQCHRGVKNINRNNKNNKNTNNNPTDPAIQSLRP